MVDHQNNLLRQWRAETPGVNHVIHFNNAGASLMPTPVIEAIRDYQEEEFVRGGYETAVRRQSQIQSTYPSLARLINAQSDEIAVVENATVAWSQAFLSIPWKSGDVIFTSLSEYASNYIAYLQIKERKGVVVEVIPNDASGQVDVEALERMITAKTKLISITHIPTNGGLINPARAIGRLARSHGILYLLDACQSVGHIPIDVEEIGCDFLSATSRKYLRGPRGLGFLYASKRILDQVEPIILDLHSANWTTADQYEMHAGARRFENWETNLANKVGMGAAADYALSQDVKETWPRIQALADNLRTALSEIDCIDVHDQGVQKCGIVSFTHSRWPAEKLQAQLLEQGINVSVIVPNGTLLDMQARGLGNMIRASVHYYNSKEEISQLIEILKHLPS